MTLITVDGRTTIAVHRGCRQKSNCNLKISTESRASRNGLTSGAISPMTPYYFSFIVTFYETRSGQLENPRCRNYYLPIQMAFRRRFVSETISMAIPNGSSNATFIKRSRKHFSVRALITYEIRWFCFAFRFCKSADLFA